MRFSINFGCEEISISRCHRPIGFFPVIISAYDDEDVSRSFLEQLDHLFMEKYGDNANSYFEKHCKRNSRESLKIYACWNGSKSVEIIALGKPLETLLDILNGEVRVRVEFNEMKVRYVTGYTRPFSDHVYSQDVVMFPTEYQVITSKEMMIDYCRDRNFGPYASCTDRYVQIPSIWRSHLEKPNSRAAFCGKIKVEVSTCGFNYTVSCASERSLVLHDMNKTIFEETILPDAVIIGKDGKEIKCHRSFLAASSCVLAKKFRNTCQESTCTIEMKNMSEDVINAFLSYLYFGDLTTARENVQLLSELADAGHKYEIKSLVEAANGILLK